MYPFRKLIYSLRNENTSPLTKFCFSGYWSSGDPLHPFGGNVMYIDQYGETQSVSMIFQDFEFYVMAISIISYYGCEPIVCDTGIPAPAYYTYDVSSTATNNMASACALSPDLNLYTELIPLITGTRFFSDVLLLNPFNGNSFYRSLRSGGTMKRVQISSTGYVMSIENC